MNILIASMIAALPLLPAVRSERITDAKLPAEGYRIRIGADGRADIEAADAAGRFYAEKTLAQLPKPHPACEIEDWPAYSWRGILLDESRHFFGKDAVKRLLDRMADFKFNVLHWHLMDSQGNRFPLPEYPRMNTVGATRPSPDYQRWIHDEGFGTYGPFGYSPTDIAEILAYAKARFIRVVPEVEIPGHSREVLLSYPEFFCGTSRQLSIACAFASGHVPDDVLCNTAVCLGNDDVIRFFEYCLDEVCRLFPDSDVIHIGGDECPRKNWKTCPKCQARIRSLGLKDEDALQAWVTRHFTDYLAKKGRRAIGWDEVFAGDPGKDTVIQGWHIRHGNKFGLKAAEAGYPTIVSDLMRTYFSVAQGVEDDPFTYLSPGMKVPLAQAYSFDPFDGMTDKARPNVIGAECCMWSECTWNLYDLEWKLYPRACAFAERVWSGTGLAFADFETRMATHRKRLIAAKVCCAPLR